MVERIAPNGKVKYPHTALFRVVKGRWVMKMLFFLTLVLSSISICCAFPPAEITLNGRATPFYGNTANSSQQTVIDIMRKAKLAEQMADVIQSGVRLRKDIIVGIESCGEPNAFFDPKRHAIVIYSEFIELTVKAMYADDRLSSTLSKPQLNTWMFGVIWSVYFHELAHAIISTNDVPITGREEDVADQFLIWYAVNYLNLKKRNYSALKRVKEYFQRRKAREHGIIVASAFAMKPGRSG